MQQTPHRFQVSYQSQLMEQKSIIVESCSTTITDLKPGTEYNITVSTQLNHGGKSQPAYFNVKTGVGLADLLSTLGLRDLHGGKLALSRVLEINSNTVTDKPAESLEHLPWIFLKKLMMSNLNARNIKCVSQNFDEGNDPLADSHADSINPLDVITAVLHCADPFLQQEMVSKMAMCQFAVPLLMPNIDSGQSTLMLWALRGIIKKYRHLSSADAKTFVEGRIVQIDMPVISFVRLGQCSLSKSLILNKLLSNPRQHNETFVHYGMEGGDVPRKIADGLVEIGWYLPCGNNNVDIFTQPVAIANLRGDARTLEAQMSFLLQVSTAVFIFCDDLESDLSILTSRGIEAKLFLVINSQSKTFNKETLNATCRKHNFAVNNVIVKKKQSDADILRVLRTNVTQAIEKNQMKTTIEDMAAVASQVRILVDEHYDECAKGKLIAEEITRDLTDVVQFKENQLPLHGKTWKEISQLEKEICRMKKAGKDIEQYRCSLQNKEKELRKIQKQTSISDAMKKFITGISQSRTQRLYFLKWLQILLNNCSRQNLSSLREKYKECCQSASEEIEQMAHLDEQISNCSLGPEHFIRELGQIYEAASFPPLNDPARHQYQDLPKLCAQMLLDGFPIELVDGDASNIPLKWISEVLTQLHVMVKNNSRILVLTVLGVQSTGKSTLLNTMFGVQFAVSSGRCTRGAFMLLTKVSEEYKPQLKCDFIMIIDTEGLKSPELAALDTSYEHDNELATLVIGLSDVTIINIAMENSTEMKDILQIAVHAFLRMKEVGKKPRCLFVHQNVSDMAAHDSNLRDRKKIVEQLDEMTRAAARMEKKANTKFTDVMEYDPDRNTHYIPGLWHGTPPMAPVNAGYSEAVYVLKKSLISSFQMCHFQGNDAKKFLERTMNLWDAVKFENFIFSFRNSLLADAYANLRIEYNRWEWEFQKTMNSWMISKETYISNFGVIDNHVQKNNLRGELRNLLKEASMKVSQEEEKMLQQLEKYFERKDSHVALVEKYKADFKTSAQSLRRETEASIKYSLQRAVEIKEGMERVNTIKSTQAEMMERKVQELLKACQKKNAALSDYEIEREFEDMWKTTVEELSVSLPKQDVVQETLHELRLHFETKTGAVKKAINKEDFEKSGQTGFAVNCHWWENKKAMFVGIVCHGEPNKVAREIQELCDKIISDCLVIVSDIVKAENDFNKTYIKEILNKIDEGIKEGQKKFNINEQCESSLKFHICYKAAVKFQKMHDRFIEDNDPKNCQEKSKSKFLEEFKDLYHERDQCQKKAAEFTESCLKPAVRCYVIKNLGPDIADDMMTGDAGQDYSTRTNFQYALLKQLLEKNDFKEYQEYIKKYRHFVEKWILQDIVGKFSDEKMDTIKKKHLSRIIAKITTVLSESIEKVGDNTEMKDFIQSFCKSLGEQLSFQKDGRDNFLILNNANTQQFAKYLRERVEDMETSLTEEYSKPENIEETIKGLPFKPHDLLFKRLCGCGEQCPFCKTPCEAGAPDHTTHFSSMHRSRALGGHSWFDSGKLVIDICTTAVISDKTFNTAKTNGEYHPYKKYKEIYPDWEIPGDSSTKSSDYWKYVLKTFNEDFAKLDDCIPADIPDDWKSLTDHDARRSLKKAFRQELNMDQ